MRIAGSSARRSEPGPNLAWSAFLWLALFALAGCGGGGGGTDGTSAPELPPVQLRLVELRLSIDGQLFAVVTDFTEPVRLGGDGILVASTPISLEVSVDAQDRVTKCQIAGHSLSPGAGARLVTELRAAYLHEELDLTCQAPGSDGLHQSVIIESRDPQLEAALDYFLTKLVRRDNDLVPEDPYSGYRVNSYYSEFQRLVMAAEVYDDPELFGVDPQSEPYRAIEAYLLNSSESFFQPCVHYDFDTGPTSQCRSPARVGKYYRWRSPLNEGDPIGSAHAMAEWRAAAGIAQAIKAILLAHAANDRRGCPVSDEPSRIRDASVVCRALNIRRLLHDELWKKWSDEDWVGTFGYSYQSTIQGTDVSHWISWTEYMVDLFQATAHIGAEPVCRECAQLRTVPSRIDGLLDYFYEYGQGHISISCRPPHVRTGCDFKGDDLQVAKAVDLSHLSSVIQLVTMYHPDKVCRSDGRRCVEIRALAETMNQDAWVDSIANDGPARGFPKFDLFFNGYCSRAAFDTASPLHGFCVSNWLTEAGAYPLHRNLFGFVNLGRYDRDLMLKLRLAADENHDRHLDGSDEYLQTFSVMLYEAMARGAH